MVFCHSGYSKNKWEKFWTARDVKTVTSWSKKRMQDILNSYNQKDMRVLDLGCGSGYFSSYFLSRGNVVYSMDYSKKSISLTRRKTEGKAKAYINGNIMDSKIVSELNTQFDIIFSDGLLEHYPEAEQDIIINNMKKVKKESGYIINFVPNKFSFWSLVRPLVMDIEEEPFVLRKLVDLHRKNGLSVISSGGINVLPFRISPEKLLGRYMGMLFYCIAK